MGEGRHCWPRGLSPLDQSEVRGSEGRRGNSSAWRRHGEAAMGIPGRYKQKMRSRSRSMRHSIVERRLMIGGPLSRGWVDLVRVFESQFSTHRGGCCPPAHPPRAGKRAKREGGLPVCGSLGLHPEEGGRENSESCLTGPGRAHGRFCFGRAVRTAARTARPSVVGCEFSSAHGSHDEGDERESRER